MYPRDRTTKTIPYTLNENQNEIIAISPNKMAPELRTTLAVSFFGASYGKKLPVLYLRHKTKIIKGNNKN
ncbi:hypothetical protein R50072_37000 [Simiduia litorea]